jgi:hypothetical protein
MVREFIENIQELDAKEGKGSSETPYDLREVQ